jgi:hypothetical protein
VPGAGLPNHLTVGLRSGTRLVVWFVGSCVLVVFAAASASAAKPQLAGRQAVSLGQSAAAAAGASRGVEAALPANAETGGEVNIASIPARRLETAGPWAAMSIARATRRVCC